MFPGIVAAGIIFLVSARFAISGFTYDAPGLTVGGIAGLITSTPALLAILLWRKTRPHPAGIVIAISSVLSFVVIGYPLFGPRNGLLLLFAQLLASVLLMRRCRAAP